MKATLVMDIPKSCYNCCCIKKISKYYNALPPGYYCKRLLQEGMGDLEYKDFLKKVSIDNTFKRLDSCPLKIER